MEDILIAIFILIFSIIGFFQLIKIENNNYEKKLKNDKDIVKMIIEECKK